MSQGRPVVVYLGLGANLGDREVNLRRALRELESFLALEGLSDLYETEPVGLPDQPWFLNAVCRGTTALRPEELLLACQGVERALGRRPGPRFAPRPIDIDLLLYGDLVLESAVLTLPHPRLHQRGFVLWPLQELAPDLRHPVLGWTVAELLARGAFETVRRVGWSAPALSEALLNH